VLVTVIAGFLLAIFRGRTPMIRMLGIVALLSGLAYLVTPLTAAGPEGDPTAFTTNLRYASPALALGALLLGVDSGLLKPGVQPWLLGSLIVLLLVQAVPVWDLHGHLWTRHFLLGAVGLAFFLVVVPVGLVLARQRGASAAMVAGGAVLALALVVAIGWPKSDDYVKDRYQASTAPHDFPVGMKAALAWFNRAQPHDSRIAVVGGRPGFKQYVFYGDDLSNRVQYVAKHGPHGAYLPIASEASQHLQRGPAFVAQCREWVQALNDGGYRYAVIGPDQRTQSVAPVEALWTAAAGGSRVETNDDISVFSIDRPLDPAACASRTPRPSASST
jgi:peptidoglycan/LPS O-acetylase OafA/YrhL